MSGTVLKNNYKFVQRGSVCIDVGWARVHLKHQIDALRGKRNWGFAKFF